MLNRKVVLIGAGKLAHSLTSALEITSYNIESVISKKKSSAKHLAGKFLIKNYSDSLKDIPSDVNIFLLTVPDGEIRKVAEKLSKSNRDFKDCICVHFSGVENISSLNSLAKKGCATGSLHIIKPFPSKNIVKIKNSPASIEAKNRRSFNFLIQLCRSLQLKPHRINSKEKVLHHLAAVYSSNFLVGNLFNAFSLISSKDNSAKEILLQTTQSALNNVFKLSPSKALSGPVDRGDLYTIKKHLEVLDAKIRKSRSARLKLFKLNYIVQSLSLLEVAEKKYGKLNKDHLEIKKFLENEL